MNNQFKSISQFDYVPTNCSLTRSPSENYTTQFQWCQTMTRQNSPSTIMRCTNALFVGVVDDDGRLQKRIGRFFNSPFFAPFNAISVWPHNEMHIIDNNNCSTINYWPRQFDYDVIKYVNLLLLFLLKINKHNSIRFLGIYMGNWPLNMLLKRTEFNEFLCVCVML